MGVKDDYTREVMAIINIPSESASGWKEVLEGIKQRGVHSIGVIISDNLTGLDSVIPLVFKNTKRVVHLKRNILNKVAPKHKAQVAEDLLQLFNMDLQEDTVEIAYQRFISFSNRWKKQYRHIGTLANNEMNELYFTL